jgi:hypothetical protein
MVVFPLHHKMKKAVKSFTAFFLCLILKIKSRGGLWELLHGFSFYALTFTGGHPPVLRPATTSS